MSLLHHRLCPHAVPFLCVSSLCGVGLCVVSVLHDRVLVSVYRGLLGASECPPVYGSHWEAVGFQGNDPSTDVRGAGMFGLLLLLAFVQQRHALANQLFKLSTDAHQVRVRTRCLPSCWVNRPHPAAHFLSARCLCLLVALSFLRGCSECERLGPLCSSLRCTQLAL